MTSSDTSYKNILVVRTDRIGDVVLTTPVLSALRKKFPSSRISVLIAAQTKDIIQGNPAVNEVIVDDRKGPHRGLGFLKLVNEIRKRKFDAAIILHTKRRTNILCFLAGIPKRAGFRDNKFGFFLTDGLPDTRPLGIKHESEYCFDAIRPVAGTFTEKFPLHIPVKPEKREWAKQFLKNLGVDESERVVAIHPGASCPSRRWSPKKFAELINLLQEKYLLKILLIGANDAEEIAKEIFLHIKKPIISLIGKTSISELVAIFSKCQLLISNDSGPVHLASAVGASVIALFGRDQPGISPTRWRPLGERDVVLHKRIGCEICLAHNCMIGFECLEAISPAEVFEAAVSILESP